MTFQIIQIKNFELLPVDFTLHGGELGLTMCFMHTRNLILLFKGPTLKLKRAVVKEMYMAKIEKLYGNESHFKSKKVQ